jgi:hypothetical protein
MEFYHNDKGEVGVLISVGYGAGWSTWNDKRMAYDRRVIEYWLTHKEEHDITRTELKAAFVALGYDDVYFGGWGDLTLKFFPPGTTVRIKEYDGCESVEILHGMNDWMVLV